MGDMTAPSDLKTLMRTFDPTNVANMATRPIVILQGESERSDSSGLTGSGIFIIGEEAYDEIVRANDIVSEISIMKCSYEIRKKSQLVIFKDALKEFRQLLRVNNQSGARTYIYTFGFTSSLNQPIAGSYSKIEVLIGAMEPVEDGTT